MLNEWNKEKKNKLNISLGNVYVTRAHNVRWVFVAYKLKLYDLDVIMNKKKRLTYTLILHVIIIYKYKRLSLSFLNYLYKEFAKDFKQKKNQ